MSRRASRQERSERQHPEQASIRSRFIKGTILFAVLLIGLIFGIPYVLVSERDRNEQEAAAVDMARLARLDTSDMQPLVADLIEGAGLMVAKSPRSGRAWGHYGIVCDAHQLFAEAEICYRRAQSLEPREFRWPYHLAVVRENLGASSAETVELLRRAAELEPDYPPTFVRIGRVLTREGRVREAVAELRKAISLDPNLAFAHASLGQAYLMLADSNAAITHLEQAVRLQPNDGPLRASLAQAYQQAGRTREAEEAESRSRSLETALMLPDPIRFKVSEFGLSSEICAERAKRNLAGGEFERAIADLRIVIEVRPQDADAHAQMGRAWLHLRRLPEAETWLARALQLDPHNVSASFNLASIRAAQGRLPEAITHYEMAVRKRPTDSRMRAAYATALARTGRLDAAIEQFQAAATAGRLSGKDHFNWGSALLNQQNVDAAIHQYEVAITLLPSHVEAHWQLGQALEKSGRLADAIDAYQRVIQIDPQHRRVADARGRIDAMRP